MSRPPRSKPSKRDIAVTTDKEDPMTVVNEAATPYQCGSCGSAIPIGRNVTNCPRCHLRLPDAVITAQRAKQEGVAEQGSVTACIVLGLAGLGVGLYFLINPSASGYGNIANMHALAVGQSLTVAGSVLLGFGIRPR